MKRGTVHLVAQTSVPREARAGQAAMAAAPEGIIETGLGPGKGLLRPAVVVSREAINRHGPVVLVCPLVEVANTGQLYPSDVRIEAPDGGLTSDSVVLTGQLRAIARTQLGELSETAMRQVDLALRITLDLE